mmetsp:Transcript_8212/g.24954  ORF Transcript_8212/g.24954 Transcript_8212/m.24954 type:complete len:217 (+) Transcript_8212:83-733(+)
MWSLIAPTYRQPRRTDFWDAAVRQPPAKASPKKAWLASPGPHRQPMPASRSPQHGCSRTRTRRPPRSWGPPKPLWPGSRKRPNRAGRATPRRKSCSSGTTWLSVPPPHPSAWAQPAGSPERSGCRMKGPDPTSHAACQYRAALTSRGSELSATTALQPPCHPFGRLSCWNFRGMLPQNQILRGGKLKCLQSPLSSAAVSPLLQLSGALPTVSRPAP